MDGRRVRGVARRKALVDAALAVLARDGAAGVTHRAVAAQAGVPLGSAGYHFAGIDDLLTTALMQAAARLAEALRGVKPTPAALARWMAEPERREPVIAGHELALLAARRPALRGAATAWLDVLAEVFVPTATGPQRRAFVAVVQGLSLHTLLLGADAADLEAALRHVWPAAPGGSAAELRSKRLVLRPTVAGDGPALWAIHASPEVARWWDEPDEGFPMEDEPDAQRLTIWLGDEIAGMIEFHEEPTPKYRSAGIDIFVAPALHGRGIGTEAVTMLARHLIEDRGHHRLTIDPAADNHAAVACYRRAGFTDVGRLRLSERDSDGPGWHDGLLMELVVPPRT